MGTTLGRRLRAIGFGGLVLAAAMAAEIAATGPAPRLAPLVADGMVLQRESIVTIAGHGHAGWPVVVAGTWGTLGVTRADASGAWRATLRTRGAGGPYRVLVWAGGPSVVHDVWIGETWLCSGQSNMDLGVATAGMDAGPPLAEDTPPIHLFTVTKAFADVPRTSCGGAWRTAEAAAVQEFSAVCWAFGREIHAALGVPVGLVASTVPGSESEFWTSERGLARLPDVATRLDVWADLQARYEDDYARWVTEVEEYSATPDAAAVGNDAEWHPLGELATAANGETPHLPAGVLWFRTVVEIPAALAGRQATIALSDALDGDRAWLGTRLLHATRDATGRRVYDVPAGALEAPRSTIAIRRFSFAPEPPPLAGARLNAGDTSIAIDEWRGRVGLDLAGTRALPVHPAMRHALLFNAMIAPLTSYTVRGVVWYQGEANVARAAEYARTFPALIEDWRLWWGYTLPFYFVQLPGFAGYRPPGAITELRDAQRRTLALPATGMVATTDLSRGSDIHDTDKPEVGRRLAAWALARTYGRSDVVPSGPLYRDVAIAADTVRVRFEWASGGLVGRDEPLGGFELAGQDRRFQPAAATIDGETVVVRSPAVPAPVAVRYDWSDVPIPTLFNRAGLPASPFRSDDWPGVTDGVAWSPAPAPTRH